MKWFDYAVPRSLAEATSLLAAHPQAQLLAEGKALLAAGCTDPMVAYCYGAALQDALLQWVYERP